MRRLRRNSWRYFKSIFSRIDVIRTEGVSYLDFFEVGETSGLDVPVVWGPSDARRASERVSPAMAQEPFFYRSAGACPPRSPSSRCCLRSFRTYMSIEKRVVPFSRSFRTLIGNHADLSKHIKDLKDLRAFCVSAAIDIQVLQT